MGEGRTDEPQTNQRLTVAQAATALGITEGAVRSRIKRGTLPTTKEGGSVFVLLGGSTSTTNQETNIGAPSAQSELVEELRDRVRYLERRLDEEREARTEERRRHDTLMAQITSRIPQIEASQEPPPDASGAPETVTDEQQGRGPMPEGASPQTGAENRRPWWQRMFGG